MASFSARRANHDLKSALRLWAETAAAGERITSVDYDIRENPGPPAPADLTPPRMWGPN